MKKISFVVPCYNSEEYMERCIDSLLVGRHNIEIIIIDDGSKDKTGSIADNYQKKYPSIIKVIHKENGGHGSGVNAGLKIATGLYFKVVDSDDWLDENSLLKLIDKITEIEEKKENIDLFICNYIYDHLYENKQKEMRYKNIFKEGKITTWKEIKKFKPSQYMIMHSLIYKTSVLKKCKISLPEHTFYVDNIFAYIPLTCVRTMMYLNIPLYHYFIGREDQSVNERVMISRVDQQIKITKIIAESVDLQKVKEVYPKLYKYLLSYLSMMLTIASVLLLKKKDKESLQKRKELWNSIKEIDKKAYKKLKYCKLAGLTYIPTKVGSFITLNGYKVAKKVYRFN